MALASIDHWYSALLFAAPGLLLWGGMLFVRGRSRLTETRGRLRPARSRRAAARRPV